MGRDRRTNYYGGHRETCRKIGMIRVYAPSASDDVKGKENFYDGINDMMSPVSSSKEICTLDDFQVKVCNKN